MWDNAIASLISMRKIEGEGLKKDILKKFLFEKILKDITDRAPKLLKSISKNWRIG
jgi:uncharacterized protein YicC (UPF0701 family)